MDKWEPLIDRMIRESMERGEFDDLPGAGRPIDLSENPYEAPELRPVHRLLRNAGFAPAWIEERKDIDALLEGARTMLLRAKELYGKGKRLSGNPQWERAAKEFREIVAELNQRIRLFNLKAPATAFHRQTLDCDRLIRELETEVE